MRTRSSLAVITVLAALLPLSCAGPAAHPRDATRAPQGDAAPLDAAAQDVGADAPQHLPYLGASYDLGPEELPDADLVRALDAVAAEAGRPPRDAVTGAPWDHASPPKYLDLVAERYGLTASERALLMKSGVVVLSRVTFPSYGDAMHEIHRQELPLYVTVDSVLEAVFRSHEQVLVRAESALASRLDETLASLQKALVTEANAGTPRYSAEAVRDADVYLGVARTLLGGGGDPAVALGQTGEVTDLTQKAMAAARVETVDLFGRPRKVDFTFYEPRGVYLDHAELHGYFRAMVWLTRLELNLVSRGSRSSAPTLTVEETPREATLALVLADLAERSGVSAEIARVDAYQRKVAGKREDVPLVELTRIAKKKAISLRDPATAQAALRAEIGGAYVRTVNQHVMPYGTSEAALPVITTFFGTSITPDARSLTQLVPSDGAPHVPRGPELAYLLGADEGAKYIDPTASLTLMRGARADLEASLRAGSPDLHAAWTVLVRGAAAVPAGTTPSFFSSRAHSDRRVSTAIAGYAQIHHAHVLHTAQVYDFAGCTIPDAYVEPALAALEGTLAYAKRLDELAGLLPTDDAETAKDVHDAAARLAKVTSALRDIARDELAGRPVAGAGLALLRMVAEYVPAGGGYEASHPGRFNGFYPYMHAERSAAFTKVPFSIDHFTSTRLGQVAFVGEGRPALGVFVVDVGGAPRVMVGPVTRAYDRVRPLAKRRLDEEAGDGCFQGAPVSARCPGSGLDVPPIAAHERSYVAPHTAPPELTIAADQDGFTIVAKRPLGGVTVELVDEHGATTSRVLVKEVRPPSGGSDAPGERFTFPPAKGDAKGVGYRFRLASGEVTSFDGVWPSPYP